MMVSSGGGDVDVGTDVVTVGNARRPPMKAAEFHGGGPLAPLGSR
jgi:hypothetical protein